MTGEACRFGFRSDDRAGVGGLRSVEITANSLPGGSARQTSNFASATGIGKKNRLSFFVVCAGRSVDSARPETPTDQRSDCDLEHLLGCQAVTPPNRSATSSTTTGAPSAAVRVAWTMLFGWGDYQAGHGNAYWAPRLGLYRQDGGYGADVVAPLYMDDGVRNVVRESPQLCRHLLLVRAGSRRSHGTWVMPGTTSPGGQAPGPPDPLEQLRHTMKTGFAIGPRIRSSTGRLRRSSVPGG